MGLFGIMEDASECPFDEKVFQKCPFLRNINKPTNFSFSSPIPVRGGKGPIFEDGPCFDSTFKLFHGKEGIVPLSNRFGLISETQPAAPFNPLAAKAATISLSSMPFGFTHFNGSKKANNPDSQNPKPAAHEANGIEWLETGNCPIAKSYRAVSRVVPMVASTLQLPPGMKLKCPPAIVAARAALARTALVKTLRPQPLPAKMIVIALMGMALNVPLGIWRAHTVKFSLSWFAAVHAAVPFIAMLRKSVVMPKAAMVLTIMASIMGQVIGNRAEMHRLKILNHNKIVHEISITEDCDSSASVCIKI